MQKKQVRSIPSRRNSKCKGPEAEEMAEKHFSLKFVCIRWQLKRKAGLNRVSWCCFCWEWRGLVMTKERRTCKGKGSVYRRQGQWQSVLRRTLILEKWHRGREQGQTESLERRPPTVRELVNSRFRNTYIIGKIQWFNALKYVTLD